jgi:hypothetical protein
MTIKVSIVPTEHAFAIWPKVRHHLSRCVEYTGDRFEVEDMLTQIVEGDQELWIAYDDDTKDIKGVVTTGYLNYPRKRALCMQFTGGDDLKEWKEPMLEMLQQWAFDNNCDVIECSGRPGWAKIFDTDGHKPLWQTFELPVADHGLGGHHGR